jgi:hemoglobin/transferrin/lactoferrin receptor protein
MIKYSTLSLAVFTALPISFVNADDYEHIEVTASRIQANVNEIPASITVIDEKELKQLNANKLSDIFRYQAGVTVEKSGHRHGDANINIRGIGGNRILMVRDGTIMPDGFGSAGVSQGRGNFDPFSLQQVEILKGPASALYGSNALGGVVILNTADPESLVIRENGKHYASVNAGYFSEDERTRLGVTVASEVAGGYGLFQAQSQVFSETDINSDYIVNPKDGDSQSFLAKWKVSDDDYALQFIADYFRQQTENILDTNVGPVQGPPGSAISMSNADDDSNVWRVGVKHELFDLGLVDKVKWQLDYQYSNYEQYEQQQTDNPGSVMPPIPAFGYLEEEWEEFEQKQINFSIQAEKEWRNHHVLVGFDYLDKSVTRPVDRLRTDVITSQSTNVINGTQHPGKTFPDADVTQFGAFIQDYISIGDNLTLVAGLRFDQFENKPDIDQAYENFNISGATPEEYSDNAVSPHLGLVYNFSEKTSIYANYTSGFRSPPVAEQYISRAILIPVPGVPHEVIPNNELESETSNGFEVGVRWSNNLASVEVSAYQNQYDDFIDSRTIGYREMPPLFTDKLAIRQIQYQNVDAVEIKGAEITANVILDSILPSGWHGNARFAYSIIDGENITDNTGLNSIPPNSGVFGFNISPNESLTVNWSIRGANKAEDAEPLKKHGQSLPSFEPPGYAVQDIYANYFISEDFAVSLTVYNLTDKKYWASHTKGNNGAGNLDAFVEPGRNFAAAVSYQF